MASYLAFLLTAALLQADERLPFVCPEGNYKLSYPTGWSTFKPPEEFIQLAIGYGTSVIMFCGLETNSTVEEVIEVVEAELRLRAESVKEIFRQDTRVAGERAMRIQTEARMTGLKFIMTLTAFTHQGFAYRVIGVRRAGSDTDFDKVYDSILKEFSFLEERKEWLAKFEGKPARTALLGGLVSFELNRPRWIETTFDDSPEYNFLDRAHYQFFPGGAWIKVRAREARGDVAAEKEELRQELSTGLQKLEDRDIRAGKKKHSCMEITGSMGDVKHILRGTVFVEDGIAVQLWFDSVASQRENTRRDWEQLLDSFRLRRQSMPEDPPAFPHRSLWWMWTRPDEGLALFLSQATRIVPGERDSQVLAISPDGTRALVRGADGVGLENLTTHKREPLTPDPSTFSATGVPLAAHLLPGAAFSPDGKRLALATEDEILVFTLQPRQIQHLKVRAVQLAFGPSRNEILACTKESNSQAPERFAVARLERVQFADGSRQRLVDFPLCRVSHPAVSPDGRQIALVSNRDYPRTATTGGHLYVCAADGSGLRQLTHDPEEIRSVAWSPDGKHLYATRRLARGDEGAVGVGGSADLYRISVETGQAENLTRSGRIERAWCTGGDLLLEVTAWDMAPSQRGIFRLAAERLAKATATRPTPPLANGRAQVKALVAKIQAALGGTPVKDVVPTPPILEKAAQAFADGVMDSFGERFDFSAASLDRLGNLAVQIDLASGREPGIVLGFGAYYGETLRKVASAEWRIRPCRFGEWMPAAREKATTSLAEVVLPFSESYRSALGAEDVGMRRAHDVLDQREGQKLVLVYPPFCAEEALREATGESYYQARKMLDAGQVKPALEILVRELQRRPKNRPLARELIALYEAAGMPEAANELTRKAVEAGSEVPELLLRFADLLAKQDPKLALRYYRRAVQGEEAPAEAFIKLGQTYNLLGQTAVAESCWRRAHATATESERRQIRKLMGLPEESGPKEISKLSREE
jgi:tetratricopeptide (TPR) repeat protein